jgi:hypothetical protein
MQMCAAATARQNNRRALVWVRNRPHTRSHPPYVRQLFSGRRDD